MKYLKYLAPVLIAVSFCGRPETTAPEADFLVIGVCPLPGYAKKVELAAGLAYVADGQGGLQIVDISDPDSAYVVGSYEPDRDVGGVALRDTFAFLALASSTSGGLVILNISDPAAPVFVGQDPSIYAYDVSAPAGDTMYAYVAASYWFIVEDVYSYPQYPTFARRFSTPGNVRHVFMNGAAAYLACEQMGLQIVDLAEPDSTAMAGWIDTPSNARHVFVLGDYAYVADGRAGLIIIDVSDIAHPVIVGQYDTPEYANGVHVAGNLAYVADGGSGLQVIDVTDPADPQPYGSLATPYANGVSVRNDTVYIADRDMGLVIIAEERQ